MELNTRLGSFTNMLISSLLILRFIISPGEGIMSLPIIRVDLYGPVPLIKRLTRQPLKGKNTPKPKMSWSVFRFFVYDIFKHLSSFINLSIPKILQSS